MKKILPVMVIAFLAVVLAGCRRTVPVIPAEPSPSSAQFPQDRVTPAVSPVIENQEIRTLTFTHPQFGYSFQHLSNLQVLNQGDGSVLVIPVSSPTGQGVANFVYISVIPSAKLDGVGTVYNYSNEWFEKLETLSDMGYVAILAAQGSEQDEWYTYTRVDDIDIDGIGFKSFENTKPWEFPAGTTERRFQSTIGGDRYLLGYYTGGDSGSGQTVIDPQTELQIIQSIDLPN